MLVLKHVSVQEQHVEPVDRDEQQHHYYGEDYGKKLILLYSMQLQLTFIVEYDETFLDHVFSALLLM